MNNTTGIPSGLVIPDTASAYNPGTGLIIFHVAILIFLCLSAIIGNAVVINVVLRDYRLHIPTFYFVVNLAVADILTATVFIPFYAVAVVKQRWVLGEPLCKANAFLISLGINATLITLSMISLDRLWDITNPLYYPLKMTSRRMRTFLVLGWVHSVFWAAGPLIEWGSYQFDRRTNTCRPDWSADGVANKSYAVLLATIAFGLPVLVMIFCYARIFMVVEKHVRDIEKTSCSAASLDSIDMIDSAKPHEPVHRHRDMRAHKMILTVIVLFFLCWAPYCIIAMRSIVLEETSGSYWSINVGLTLALFTTAVNPLVYTTSDRRFKRGFKKIFCRFRERYSP